MASNTIDDHEMAKKITTELGPLCTLAHEDDTDNTKGMSHAKDSSFHTNYGSEPGR